MARGGGGDDDSPQRPLVPHNHWRDNLFDCFYLLLLPLFEGDKQTGRSAVEVVEEIFVLLRLGGGRDTFIESEGRWKRIGILADSS